MLFKKQSPGAEGERRADKYLRGRGYEILARNHKVGGVEIDLLAYKENTLCLVEVKTRVSDAHGAPEEFVDSRKQRRLIRAGKLLLQRKAHRDSMLRFDIVSVILNRGKAEINHFEGAFEEG